MSTSLRALIVEDEVKLLNYLVELLNDEEYSTVTCTSFQELLNNLSDVNVKFDVILMDRLLHGRDSADLIETIKNRIPNVKVMILSAIDSPSEKASLLDRGADEYLSKPFDGDELKARLRALLRRNPTELKFGNVQLDSDRRLIKVGERELSLQNKEFILLRTLIRMPGKVFNKLFLYEQVWEISGDVESNVVEATINKLRRRLEEIGANIAIKSMRNKGYWVEE